MKSKVNEKKLKIKPLVLTWWDQSIWLKNLTSKYQQIEKVSATLKVSENVFKRGELTPLYWVGLIFSLLYHAA